MLSAVARDLRREYGDQYRVLRADSGSTALEMVRALKLRNTSVGLFLVDQRMPLMSGVEVSWEAIEIFPDAKRVLLTAYADTEAAIRAINEVGLNHYLMKPWDPPEEHLYPVLTDLLDDWQASFAPPFEGIRVVGHQWSAQSHQVKSFLARNLVPYQWLDIEIDEEARHLLELSGSDGSEPLVLFPDGPSLVAGEPSDRGADRPEDSPRVAVLRPGHRRSGSGRPRGGGVRRLGRAQHAAHRGEAPGGQAGMSSRIENYLGFRPA